MYLKSVILLSIFTSVFFLSSCTSYGESKTFDGLTIYYDANIAVSKVDQLGKYLVENKFTNGNEKSIKLETNDTVYKLKMVIQPNYLDSTSYINQMEHYGTILNQSVFGDSLKSIQLCDKYFEILKSISIPTL